MYRNILCLLIIANIVARCYSIQCYTCEGLITDLNNKTCSIISNDDSCYAAIGFAVDTGNWYISMGSFNGTADLYVKPKSGSPFFEQYWSITTDADSHQLWETRYFCYKDFCNPLSLASQFIKSDIKYQSFKFNKNVTQCLVCNATDYNTAKQCKNTQSCNDCELTANQYLNDLYCLTNWSSSCYKSKSMDPDYFGQILLQYEIDTKLLNIYTLLACTDSTCNSFDFMNEFLKSIKLIF